MGVAFEVFAELSLITIQSIIAFISTKLVEAGHLHPEVGKARVFEVHERMIRFTLQYGGEEAADSLRESLRGEEW